jgi:TolA-binding protein
VYPDSAVASYIDQHFTPVRIHVRDHAAEWKRLGDRFGVQWTPTVLVVDSSGQERHRIEGFLPAEDFLAQLELGRAKAAFGTGQFEEAERRFRAAVDHHPGSEAAPEALYWAGVSRYKRTNDPSALADTARGFRERYQDTSWAKKSSVWAA